MSADTPQTQAPLSTLPRRAFLGAATTLALAPGVLLIEPAQARPAGSPAAGTVRWGMLVDTRQCQEGCTACVEACQTENALHTTTQTDSRKPQWIRKVTLTEKNTGQTHSLPMMCQHCAQPPCVDVCPTGASFKRADGLVLVDRHRCIGCRYCMMACPYKARSFVFEPLTNQNPEVPRGKGCVESCTLCVHRVDKGKLPACVTACAARTQDGRGALVFGDLNDPKSAISKRLRQVSHREVRADLGLNTAVRYEGI